MQLTYVVCVCRCWRPRGYVCVCPTGAMARADKYVIGRDCNRERDCNHTHHSLLQHVCDDIVRLNIAVFLLADACSARQSDSLWSAASSNRWSWPESVPLFLSQWSQCGHTPVDHHLPSFKIIRGVVPPTWAKHGWNGGATERGKSHNSQSKKDK